MWNMQIIKSLYILIISYLNETCTPFLKEIMANCHENPETDMNVTLGNHTFSLAPSIQREPVWIGHMESWSSLQHWKSTANTLHYGKLHLFFHWILLRFLFPSSGPSTQKTEVWMSMLSKCQKQARNPVWLTGIALKLDISFKPKPCPKDPIIQYAYPRINLFAEIWASTFSPGPSFSCSGYPSMKVTGGNPCMICGNMFSYLCLAL